MFAKKKRDPVKQSLSLKTFSFGVSLSQSVETVLNPRSKLHGCTETDPIIRFNATINSQAAIYCQHSNRTYAICQDPGQGTRLGRRYDYNIIICTIFYFINWKLLHQRHLFVVANK